MCKECNKDRLSYRGICKVCSFKKRRKFDIDNIIKDRFWKIDEIDIVLENILYCKVENINNILQFLNNKSIDDLVCLLSKDLIIRGQISIKVQVECDVCKKQHSTTLSVYNNNKDQNKYCSFDCRNKGFVEFGSHRGEKNRSYKGGNQKAICTNCGKEHIKKYNSYHKKNSFGDNHNFCCQECYYEFRGNYYRDQKSPRYGNVLSKEHVDKIRINLVKRISENKMPQTLTKPHVKINNLLNDLQIKYTNEYLCKYYSIDIFLEDYNIGIEIMGDYWHTNPTKFENLDKITKQQQKGIPRDKRKRTYIAKYRDFKILYLWENEIKSNIELCRHLILKACKEELQEFNSFNYHVNNNKLFLNENIIKPYFY